MTGVRRYAVVTGAYWGFTVTDGALRMLVLLHFHRLGYSPLDVALLFLFYEFFGIVTNLVGGWIAYLGYELAGAIEPRLRLPQPADAALPMALAWRCPAALIHDHLRGESWAVENYSVAPVAIENPIPAGGLQLSAVLGDALPFDDLAALRRQMIAACPHFARIDDVEPAPWGEFGTAGAMGSEPFASPVTNFYMTDPISRASETMAQCTREFINGEATGTDG